MKTVLLAASFLILLQSVVYGQGSGFALSFDGQNDYVEIADSPSLSGGSGKSLTLEFWVKPSSISGNFPLVHKLLDSKWKDWGISVNQGQLVVAIEANGDNWEYFAGNISANVWTHVALTFDNASKMVRVYINGAESGSGASRTAGLPDTNAKVYFAKHGYSAVFFPGVLDDVRIWNFAKTAAQIQSQMTQALTGSESGLVGYWNLEEGSGQTANDVSGIGNTGQLIAGPTWVASDAPVGSTTVLRVLSPNGGEAWQTGSAKTITWTASGSIASVSIEFSSNNGSAWSTVVGNTTNDGSHPWTVPANLSNNYRIRISDAADGNPSDVSDATFSIVSATTPTLTFTDITLSAGTGGPTANGFTGGHAAIFADVTGDDRPDLYHTMLFQHPMKDLFFRNTGNNVFVNEADLRGIADYDSGSHGAVFADLDNDGDYDLYNGTTFATPGFPANNNLFRNNGSGFFTDVTAQSGMPVREWPTRAVVAFDMDKDGDLDLVAITNFAGSADPPGERNEVYRNDGNLQFTAINSGALYTAPAGQGATASDYDNDGDLDVFAANRNGDLNILRNDGFGNFTAVTPSSIGISHWGRDGISLDDLDSDGDLDLLLTGPLLTGEPDGHLYINNGNSSFSFRQNFTGIGGYTGAFADLDHDRDLDLVFAGNTTSFLNDGLGNFSAGPSIPLTGINDPRGLGFADIDNDGDMDFAIGAKRSRNWLVRNNLNGGNWLKVKLFAPNGQAGAFGARLRIYPAGQLGGQLLGMREPHSTKGYLGQSDQVVHFGLGSHTAVDLQINFLNGTVVTQSNVSANQMIVINPSAPVPTPPSIASFNPTSGLAGASVTINGNNFNGSSAVRFNGVSSGFAILSNSQIATTVPAGATTGKISVTNPDGTATSLNDFVVLNPPTISSFSPTSGGVGASVTILGNHFTGATSVTFNNVSASFNVDSNTQIRATVPSAATTGLIRVTTPAGTAVSAGNFAVTFAPIVTSFNPTSGLIGSNVTISGNNFNGATAVRFNGTLAAFTIDSNSQIRVVVPVGATTGKISVTNLDGTTTSVNDFVVLNPPTIGSFSPTSGGVGAAVTILGNHFTGASSVLFNGLPASFVVDSNTQIRATVPASATSGLVSVTNAAGAGISANAFVVTFAPVINTFAPASGLVGSAVTITGNNFNGVNAVNFNGVSASFTIDSNIQIRATVPAGATTGKISVTNLDGTTQSANNFIVLLPPSISSFTPESGPTGTAVTITGNNFSGTSLVQFNGAAAAGFTVVSNTQIRVSVPASATSGPISVTTAAGTTTSSTSFNVTVTPPGSTFNFNPIADSYVRSSNPNSNYGSADDLRVRKANTGELVFTYLKFDVTGLSGTITSAKIRLNVLGSSNQGGSIYSVSSNFKSSANPWTENGINYTNAPPISGSALGSLGQVTLGQTVEFDVTAAIAGNGTYSFGMSSTSNDAANYQSREGVNPPVLVIETNGGTPTNPPAISSLTPTSGGIGTEVTISGVNFIGTTAVTFNGVAAAFNFDSNSQIRASVPAGATTGVISVTNGDGTGSSASVFTVTAAPIITGFTPTNGSAGTEVTISGTNFIGTSAVAFNGVAAAFNFDSNSQIRASVPAGATTGVISVTNNNGTGSSASAFMITSSSTALTLSPTDDTFGSSSNATKNYGDDGELRVRQSSSSKVYSFLKFNINGLSGAVSSAVLRVTVLDGSDSGGEVYSVSNNYKGTTTPWTESGLNWNNAPLISGVFLDATGAVAVGQTVEFDVTAAITGEGVFSFAIKNNSSDILRYSPRELSNPPTLVIVTGTALKLADSESQEAEMQLELDGDFKIATPGEFNRADNYPNPFNAETTIEYALPEATRVRITIYNLLGHQVRTLVDEYQSAGFKKIKWDGRGDAGYEVGSGVYFLRLEEKDNAFTRRITLQK